MTTVAASEIEVVRHPRARRLKLAVDPVTGRARLTLPPRVALARAMAWADQQGAWLAAQRARRPQERPFVDGATVAVDDALLTIAWREAAPRRVVRDGDIVVCGGPRETLARRVGDWLKRTALDVLSADTAHYAALAGVGVARVAIGDARGRWGSCAASGAIRYSWRLILAPAWVRRATVAHEVAHRLHMNHGAAFHACVAQLYGEDPTPARAWLRRHGAALHQIGRAAADPPEPRTIR